MRHWAKMAPPVVGAFSCGVIWSIAEQLVMLPSLAIAAGFELGGTTGGIEVSGEHLSGQIGDRYDMFFGG